MASGTNTHHATPAPKRLTAEMQISVTLIACIDMPQNCINTINVYKTTSTPNPLRSS